MGPGSVPFDELPPLGGLPQQVPEVVRVLLRLAVSRERPGEGPPVGAGRGTNVNPPLSRRPDETGSDLSRRGRLVMLDLPVVAVGSVGLWFRGSPLSDLPPR